MVSRSGGAPSRIAQGAGLLLFVAACSTPAPQEVTNVTRFRCTGKQSFTVERDEKAAVVIYSGVRYDLPRRSSSIGQRYATSRATLIIDGDMAAFVSEAVLNLDLCRAAQPELIS